MPVHCHRLQLVVIWVHGHGDVWVFVERDLENHRFRVVPVPGFEHSCPLVEVVLAARHKRVLPPLACRLFQFERELLAALALRNRPPHSADHVHLSQLVFAIVVRVVREVMAGQDKKPPQPVLPVVAFFDQETFFDCCLRPRHNTHPLRGEAATDTSICFFFLAAVAALTVQRVVVRDAVGIGLAVLKRTFLSAGTVLFVFFVFVFFGTCCLLALFGIRVLCNCLGGVSRRVFDLAASGERGASLRLLRLLSVPFLHLARFWCAGSNVRYQPKPFSALVFSLGSKDVHTFPAVGCDSEQPFRIVDRSRNKLDFRSSEVYFSQHFAVTF
mmetsp:Transcript_4936/g.9549  ORF Transcript_4936/g.9549 Transcript_4936/m.9549 type:complete len:328 (+) Transcript_4936:1189-2172(+)